MGPSAASGFRRKASPLGDMAAILAATGVVEVRVVRETA